MLATKLGAPSQLYRMNERLYGVFLLLLALDVLLRTLNRRKRTANVVQDASPERAVVLAR